MKEVYRPHEAFRSVKDSGVDLNLTRTELPWIADAAKVRLVDAELAGGEKVRLGSAVRNEELQAFTADVGDTIPNTQFHMGVSRVVSQDPGIDIVDQNDVHVLYKLDTRNSRGRATDGYRRGTTTFFLFDKREPVPTYIKVASVRINKVSKVEKILRLKK